MEDVQIEIRDAVVAHRNLRQERQRPSESRAEDDIVDVGDGGAVLEMHRFRAVVAGDVRDGWSTLDLRVLECLVAKVDVVFAADDGKYGRLREINQADCRVCC